MKKNFTKSKITTVSILALSLLITGVGVANAYDGDVISFSYTRNMEDFPDLTDEQKETFNQMHELRMSGDFEGAQALAEEAGILGRHGHFRGGDESSVDNKPNNREDVRTALENNDYDAFLVAITGSPMEETMTSEIFSKMVEAHNLRQEGDFEASREIMKELGFGVKRGMGGGFMKPVFQN